jgi:tetratricopeptide (TPR) repeat protein
MSHDSKFSERVSGGGGLVRDEVSEKRVDLSGLVTESIDLSKLDLGGSPELDIMGAVNMPAAGGGLQVDADMSKLSRGIQNLKAKQANEKLGQLMSSIYAAMDKCEYKRALTLLDQALQLDPNSGQLWFLKGFCYMNMEDFEQALPALDKALNSAPDAETMVLIMMLKGLCMRQATQKIAEKVRDLVKQNRAGQALSLVEQELKRQPGNPTLLYYRGGLLMLMGKLAEAEMAINEAIRIVGQANAGMLLELLGAIRFRRHEGDLEKARTALRRRNPAEAIRVLELHRSSLQGSEKYDSIYAYACGQMGGGLFSSYRKHARILSERNRQHTLQWLFEEEIQAATKALESKDYSKAREALGPAMRRDGRCGLVNFLMAMSVYQNLQNAFETKQQMNLTLELKNTQDAAQWAFAAQVDMQLTAAAMQIRKQLETIATVLQKACNARNEAKPVNDLVTRHNSLMEQLDTKGLGSKQNIENYAKQFRQIRDDASKLRRGRSAENGGELLNKVHSAADSTVKQLEAAAKVSDGDALVKDCFDKFNSVMEYYSRNPISDIQEFREAQAKMTAIQKKIAQARRLKVSAGAASALNQLENAIENAMRLPNS